MTDPSDLLRRAAEPNEQTTKRTSRRGERLLRMAHHYVEIAESEEWLAAHPASIASLTNALTPKPD
jgi:hypothetical protein